MIKHMSTKVDSAVDSLSQRIGARVRIEREGRGWSLTDLAAHSGVSRAMVHKLERGESSPTATLLARLSGAFGLSMSQLIARAEAKEGRLLRRADQPVWTDPQTRYVRTHVSPPSDLPLDLVQVVLPAGARVPMPAAAYTAKRQLIWVLAGSLVFMEGTPGMRWMRVTAWSWGRLRTACSATRRRRTAPMRWCCCAATEPHANHMLPKRMQDGEHRRSRQGPTSRHG